MSLKDELEKKQRAKDEFERKQRANEAAQQEPSQRLKNLLAESEAKLKADTQREQERVNKIHAYARQSGLIDLFNEAQGLLAADSHNSEIRFYTDEYCREYSQGKKDSDMYYIMYTLTWQTPKAELHNQLADQNVSVYVNLQGKIMFFPRLVRYFSSRNLLSYLLNGMVPSENSSRMETHSFNDTIPLVMWKITKHSLTERFAHHLANPSYGASHDPFPAPPRSRN